MHVEEYLGHQAERFPARANIYDYVGANSKGDIESLFYEPLDWDESGVCRLKEAKKAVDIPALCKMLGVPEHLRKPYIPGFLSILEQLLQMKGV